MELLARVEKLEQFAADLAELHHLTPDGGRLLAILLVTIARGRSAGRFDADDLERAALALDDEAVTELFVDKGATGLGVLAADDDIAWSRRLAGELVGRGRGGPAGAHVVLARCHEVAGDLLAMERTTRQALAVNPGHRVALVDLGDLHSLRGDLRQARRCHESAGLAGFGWVAVAAQHASTGAIRAGRNEPCPCGSGAKHKGCCARTGGWPLGARAMMLHSKIGSWLDRPAGRRRLLPLACAAAGVTGLDEAPELVVTALVDELLCDVHLFEGGGLATALDEVGPLLPDDEAALLERWVPVRHDVWQVVRRPATGGPWTLRNTRDGTTCDVAGLGVGRPWTAGTLLWAALVPGDRPSSPDVIAAGEALALDPAEAVRLIALLDQGVDAPTIAHALLSSKLAASRAAADAAIDFGEDVAVRARWLFGDDAVPAAVLGNPGLVDDLITTTYMAGGGFSPAADVIRAAGHQLLAAEPPEMWPTALRLVAEGHDKGEVLVLLAAAGWAARCAAEADPTLDQLSVHRERLGALPNLAPPS